MQTMINIIAQFQSTLPYGSDLFVNKKIIEKRDFNPLSLAGATFIKNGGYVLTCISIHAPSRERLKLRQIAGKNSLISIHAPSRERPETGGRKIWTAKISIHAPSRERRKVHCAHTDGQRQFQSTLPRGSDIKTLAFYLLTRPISIHAPSRERRAAHTFFTRFADFNPRSLAGAT